MANKSDVEIEGNPCILNGAVISPTGRQLFLREQRNPSYYNGLWPSKVPLYMTRYVVNLSYQNFKEEERLSERKKKKKSKRLLFGEW